MVMTIAEHINVPLLWCFNMFFLFLIMHTFVLLQKHINTKLERQYRKGFLSLEHKHKLQHFNNVVIPIVCVTIMFISIFVCRYIEILQYEQFI